LRQPAAATLWHGRSVTIRPVQPDDEFGEQAFVKGLSPASRYSRFHFGLRELPPALLSRMIHVDQRRHVAVVAQATDDVGDEEIAADARYVLRDDSDDGEFAIVVADAWQGLGLGRQLMQHLLALARRNGVPRLFGDVLRSNLPMIALVRRLGGSLTRHPDDWTLTRASCTL